MGGDGREGCGNNNVGRKVETKAVVVVVVTVDSFVKLLEHRK